MGIRYKLAVLVRCILRRQGPSGEGKSRMGAGKPVTENPGISLDMLVRLEYFCRSNVLGGLNGTEYFSTL